MTGRLGIEVTVPPPDAPDPEATEVAVPLPDAPDPVADVIAPDTEPEPELLEAEVALPEPEFALEVKLPDPKFEVPPPDNEPLVAEPDAVAEEPAGVADSVEVGSSLQPARAPAVNTNRAAR